MGIKSEQWNAVHQPRERAMVCTVCYFFVFVFLGVAPLLQCPRRYGRQMVRIVFRKPRCGVRAARIRPTVFYATSDPSETMFSTQNLYVYMTFTYTYTSQQTRQHTLTYRQQQKRGQTQTRHVGMWTLKTN